MTEDEQLRRSWTANASCWRDAVRERRIESRRLVTDKAVVDAVLDQKPSRVLDVGCGEGWLSRELAARGIDVTGVDASLPLIEAATELGGGRFILAAHQELGTIAEIQDRPYDVVVANFALLGDGLEEVLHAFVAVAPQATLIIQTVHPAFVDENAYVNGWRIETFKGFGGEWPEAMPWYFRTIESWSRVLRDGGYSIAEIREPLHPDRNGPASILFICRHAA